MYSGGFSGIMRGELESDIWETESDDMEFGRIPEIDVRAEEKSQARWNSLAKPVGSLGELERLAVRMAGMRGTADVCAKRRTIVVFCADNGVTAEGICGSDPALTAVIAANIAAGRGNVSAMAKAAGCEVICVDVGMFSPEKSSCAGVGDPPRSVFADTMDGKSEKKELFSSGRAWTEKAPGMVSCRVRAGTRNFAREPAMTPMEAEAAISVGMELAKKLADDGADLLLAGEAGIGNTTTSAAVAAALLNLPANAVAGRGAGLDDEGLARKVRVIEEALDKYGLRKEETIFSRGNDSSANAEGRQVCSECEGFSQEKACREMAGDQQTDSAAGTDDQILEMEKIRRSEEAFHILCCVGGLDIAAMAGFYIGCAKNRVPVILDGAISAAAALLAERLAPGTRSYLLASHQSREPMAAYILEELGLNPILRAGLALGEGTGGICLLPLIDIALAACSNAATFAESGLDVNVESGAPAYQLREE